MAKVFLGLGSNIQREENIASGLQALAQQFDVVRTSPVYESEPVGFEGDAFYNLVMQVETLLPVKEVQLILRKIEHDHGRGFDVKGPGPRALDIDILLYDDLVGHFDGVTLPREEILLNAFVLWPLAEIAPADIHPLLQKSYAGLWSEYDKTRQVISPVKKDARKIA